MNHVVELFSAQDLDALRTLHQESHTSPTLERTLIQKEDSFGEDILRRSVVREGERLLGYACTARSPWHPPGDFQLEVFVHPDARGQGIGTVLAQDAVAWAARHGAVFLHTWANGNHPEFVAFAERRKFRVVQRFVTMVLEVGRAAEAVLERPLEAARQQGFSLFTFAETGQTDTASHKLFELNRRLSPYLPGNGDAFPAFADYKRDILEASWFRADGQLIAADGERWIGLVGLGFYNEGKRLHNEFTAVDPHYRRRGVAAALKAWSVRLARDLGAEEIRTGNDASNDAIIALNRQLGYRLEPGAVKLQHHLVT